MNEDELIDGLAGEDCIRLAALLSLLMPASADVGFGIKAIGGQYRLANQAMEHILSCAERLPGKTEQELLPPEVAARLARCEQCIAAGASGACEEIELRANGELHRYRWLKFPILGPDLKLHSIASIVHEIPRLPDDAATQQTLATLRQANQELLGLVAELEQVAGTDKLTGAWNRRRLDECVRNELDRLNRYEHPLSLLLIDIDHFKLINDENGHAAGDAVLRALTALLQTGLRGSDALARWGGEEFVVICPDTGRATAAMLAERLRAGTAEADLAALGSVTISIGVAECLPGESWDEWLRRADAALYRAKSAGRNRVQVAPEAPRPGAAADAGYVVASCVQLVWHAAYECGHESVDRAHRQLFIDANQLLAAMLSEQGAPAVAALVDRLVAHLTEHFDDEEQVLAAASFAGAAEHACLHRSLLDQAGQMLLDYRAGRQGIGEVFRFLAYDVVTKHLLGADRTFFPCLQSAPVSAAARPTRAP